MLQRGRGWTVVLPCAGGGAAGVGRQGILPELRTVCLGLPAACRRQRCCRWHVLRAIGGAAANGMMSCYQRPPTVWPVALLRAVAGGAANDTRSCYRSPVVRLAPSGAATCPRRRCCPRHEELLPEVIGGAKSGDNGGTSVVGEGTLAGEVD